MTPKRHRPELSVTAINEPDPEIVASAIVPLLLSWLQRERQKEQASPAEPKS